MEKTESDAQQTDALVEELAFENHFSSCQEGLQQELSPEQRRVGSLSSAYTIISLASKQAIAYLIKTIVYFINPFFITKAVDNNEVALFAVSIAGPYENISQMFGWLLQAGSAATIASCLGMNNVEKARQILTITMVIGLLIGFIIVLIFVPSLPAMLDQFVDENLGKEVKTEAYKYILPIMIGSPILIAYQCSIGVFLGTGRMWMYTFLQILQQVLYIGILSPTLLFCTNIGIIGSSIGFVCSFVPGFMISVIYTQKKTHITLKLHGLCHNVDKELIKQLVGVGIIDMISSASGIVVLGTIQSLVNKIGNNFADYYYPDKDLYKDERTEMYQNVLAAWGCMARIYNTVVGISYTITGSYLTAASFARGQKNYLRFYQLTVYIYIIACLVVFAFSLLNVGIGRYIAMIFSTNKFYLELSEKMIQIYSITGLLLPIQYISSTFCQAAGLFITGLIMSVITQIILIPACFAIMYYSTSNKTPKTNLYLSMVGFDINDAVSAIVCEIVIKMCLGKLLIKWRVAYRLRDAFPKQESKK